MIKKTLKRLARYWLLLIASILVVLFLIVVIVTIYKATGWIGFLIGIITVIALILAYE